MIKIKAKIDKVKLTTLLEGRSIKWLYCQLVKMGIDINYRALIAILNNYSECKMTYALGICEILNITVEDIFYLQ